MEHRPPALLANADYYGTLAAARCLGRNGIPLTVAHPGRLGAASWSRFIQKRLTCPPTTHSEEFLAWLLDFGRASPGHVLYPTSDDAAFIYSAHQDQLSEFFHLYQPPVQAVYGLLNKRKLHEEATAAGLKVPRTWFPESEADFDTIAREATTGLMIKPVTQVLFTNHRKGAVTTADQLRAEYKTFAQESYAPELRAMDPEVTRPMVQAFHPEANQSIYSLSGFISREGEHALRGAVKVLQLPRKLGIGICFENAEVKQSLADGITAMCKRLGYFGVFEAEFIVRGDDHLLIDFNPRFFGQLGFDVARGLPMGLLAYEAALGRADKVSQMLARARTWAPQTAPVFVHRAALDLVLRSQQASRAMPREEADEWRAWAERHPSVDAVVDADDWKPSAIDWVNRLSSYARHPRAFVRSVILNR